MRLGQTELARWVTPPAARRIQPPDSCRSSAGHAASMADSSDRGKGFTCSAVRNVPPFTSVEGPRVPEPFNGLRRDGFSERVR